MKKTAKKRYSKSCRSKKNKTRKMKRKSRKNNKKYMKGGSVMSNVLVAARTALLPYVLYKIKNKVYNKGKN